MLDVKFSSIVRLNGRYRAPAPSALSYSLFVQIAAPLRPATLTALPIESPLRRRPPRSTTNNNLLFQPRRWPFPFRERQTRTDLGPPALEGAPRRYQVSPAQPPSSLTPSSVPRLLAYHGPRFPLLPWGGRVWPQNSHHVRIHTTGPNQSAVRNRIRSASGRSKKLIARVTPVSSRATSPMKTNKNKNKRQASSSSDEGATCSDSTVVAVRTASPKTIDPSSAPTSRANDAKPSPATVQQAQTMSTAPVELTRNPVSASTQAVTAKTAPRTGAKPTAPHRPTLPNR
ncbi:hypothetical protein EVAR_82509_1 [Eumeta japonica]|uniref:Uncharacterized protein n=1 Tax=Eumeta variegata TaxID=151549 RepID=A0A4C1UXN4_EUMVA|nr:hypothetical protein EVAR_82509_1 [Eumeta japonica]